MLRKLIYALVLVLPLSCGLKAGNQLLSSQGLPASNALFPLASGRQWTYSVKPQGTWQFCKSGNVTQSVVNTSIIEGRTAFELSPLCDTTYTALWSVVGDRTDVRYGDRWVPALDTPLAANHTWLSGDTNWEWNSTPSVTVKGKTYTNCWTRMQTDTPYNAYETYCPGVGKVISHFTDVMGNGWDAQLAAKNF